MLIAALLAAVGVSDQAYDPPPGNPTRAAILDALRPSIEAQLGPNVEFVVKDLRVSRGWAYVMAHPQRKGGRQIDGKRYMPDWYDVGGLETTAILKFQKGRWNLVQSAVGATDVWYCHLGPTEIHPWCP